MALCFFRTALSCSGGYHLERGAMPLDDSVGIKCETGTTTENQGAGVWQSLVSSANFDILLAILLSASFIWIRNNSGPNTLPCGTPDVTGALLL